MSDKAKPKISHALSRVVMIPDYRESNPYQSLIAEQLEKLGVQTLFWEQPRRYLFPLHAAVRDLNVDVLHLHWIKPFLRSVKTPVYVANCVRFLADVAFVRASGVPVVWTIHDTISHETPHPVLEMWVRRAIARIVDAMILHSPEIRREIAADFREPLDAFDIVPHASFGDLYGEAPDARAAREALALKTAGKVFLNFGLMRPYKGLERLLKAWAESGLGTAGHVLLLAGRFPDPAYQEKIVRAAQPIEGVRIDLGHVPDDRVRLYLGACDAVVLPFERILTSSSLHLAITFEKPVIAPRIASVLETLGQANRFLYDRSTGGLRDALRRCAAADLEAERSAIRNRRATLIGWPEVAQMTLAVYERALRGYRGRRNGRAAATDAPRSRM